MSKKYDFSGWATRANLRCSDGRTIMKDAFKDCDGKQVPLVYDHIHNQPEAVLGHAVLENRPEGVYAYCSFNDSENGKLCKTLVEHGDITALSIFANQLKQTSTKDVMHGNIREVSLVLAGANPGASIQSVMQHSDDGTEYEEPDAGVIYTGENITLAHSDSEQKEKKSMDDENKKDPEPKEEPTSDKTVQEVFDTLNEEQKTVVYALVGEALSQGKDNEDSNEEDTNVKHNIFDNDTETEEDVLTHSEQAAIISLAKSNSVGSLRDAIEMYAERNSLQHGIDDIDSLFPEYKDVRPGAPELLTTDQGWIGTVMSKVHKSPISRIRTRQADARTADLRAKGYKKGDLKKVSGNITLLKRTTDPQTVYRKDALHRDDIIDIVDFDVVEYQYNIMRMNLMEELALAIMLGDGRDVGDDTKISEDHIRPIWLDDELYCIHEDVDIAAAKTELQGSDTSKHFGDNYVYAEAIITKALYAREKYKGSGSLDFYCTPHLLNTLLLARDLNGRRIYNSKADIAAALDVNNIYTAEQFADKTRTTADSKTKKLLGLFVNLSDYSLGSTKGGEITRFNQFDIDFNQEKYLIETRVSGALTRVYSAIALEEDVTSAA